MFWLTPHTMIWNQDSTKSATHWSLIVSLIKVLRMFSWRRISIHLRCSSSGIYTIHCVKLNYARCLYVSSLTLLYTFLWWYSLTHAVSHSLTHTLCFPTSWVCMTCLSTTSPSIATRMRRKRSTVQMEPEWTHCKRSEKNWGHWVCMCVCVCEVIVRMDVNKGKGYVCEGDRCVWVWMLRWGCKPSQIFQTCKYRVANDNKAKYWENKLAYWFHQLKHALFKTKSSGKTFKHK